MQRKEAEIETMRLYMRRPFNADTLALEKLWRNEKVRKYLGGIVAPDELITQKISFLQNQWDLHQFGLWTVFEKSANQITGLCGLYYSDDGVEISYMFFPQYWGKGLAREAVIASINYGFKTLKMERIIAITQVANSKSCQLLNKIGMSHTSSFIRFNALQCLYQITQNDWNMA